jgi:hypothetical protein
VKHDSMASSQWQRGLPAFGILLALTAGMAACDRAPERPPEAPPATVAPAASALPAPSGTEGTKRGETSNANDQPMKSMTKAEESTSMPMPGQANDHSTLAKDSKK